MSDEGVLKVDVLVAGAGAAGLVAAFRAAERGRRTVLIEKNKRPGVKILMSGGTRCNITQATDNRGIVKAYGTPGKFLHSPLAALSVQATIAMFEAEGVQTKKEPTGKIFPASDRASDVLDALAARLDRSGATLALEEPLVELERSRDGFQAVTPRRTIEASRVILTVGGRSYPGSGTSGDGYVLAAKLGHAIVTPVPALAPLTTSAAWVTELRGVTLPDVEVRVVDGSTVLASRRSSLLFAHFGLTGPAALDVSRAVSRHPRPTTLAATIDFLPDRNEEQIQTWFKEASVADGKKSIATLLAQLIPHRLAESLLHLAGVPADRRAAELAKAERHALVQHLKRASIPLTGTMGFKKAEVTAGGVSIEEVDSRTMQSKLVPGLYFAGELLDLDGPIGGYNFQAAWSTGWLAGSSV